MAKLVVTVKQELIWKLIALSDLQALTNTAVFTKDILGLQTFGEVADGLGSGWVSEALGVGDRTGGGPQSFRAGLGSMGRFDELEFTNPIVPLAQSMIGLYWVNQLCSNTIG